MSLLKRISHFMYFEVTALAVVSFAFDNVDLSNLLVEGNAAQEGFHIFSINDGLHITTDGLNSSSCCTCEVILDNSAD